jgi:hypothetical protein
VIFQNASIHPKLAEVQYKQPTENDWTVHAIRDAEPKSGFINGLFLGSQYVSLNPPTAEFAKILAETGIEPVVLDGF